MGLPKQRLPCEFAGYLCKTRKKQTQEKGLSGGPSSCHSMHTGISARPKPTTQLVFRSPPRTLSFFMTPQPALPHPTRVPAPPLGWKLSPALFGFSFCWCSETPWHRNLKEGPTAAHGAKQAGPGCRWSHDTQREKQALHASQCPACCLHPTQWRIPAQSRVRGPQ